MIILISYEMGRWIIYWASVFCNEFNSPIWNDDNVYEIEDLFI